jgi:hypothetical protein
VLPDGRIRYFMGEWRGSDGHEPSVSRWPSGVEAQTRRFLEAGFEEGCHGADALEKGDIYLEPEQTRQLRFPFIIDRVPLRPLCGVLTHSSPPMPREGWELDQLGIVALSRGKSGPFAVGAFVRPEEGRTRVVAFDPLAHTRPDFESRRDCSEQKAH